jgi:hypothetical protein
MLLSEAKEILKNNGYLVERSDLYDRFSDIHQTYFDWQMDNNTTMKLFRGGKPTKTYFILLDLSQNGEMSGVELRKKYFRGNTDNMKTWASNNAKYISTRKENGRRYFDITDAGFDAIKAAMIKDKV